MSRTVIIPMQNMRTLAQRVRRLAARAERRGMPRPAITVVREFHRELAVPDGFARLRGEVGANRTVALPMSEVRLEGLEPWLGDWSVVGYRIRSGRRADAPTISYGDVPDEMRSRPVTCDHCESARSRKVTFVLRHRDRRDAVEVGGTCVGDFTGVAEGPRAAEGLADLGEIQRLLSEAESSTWMHGGAQERQEDCRLVLAVANRTISERGWISSRVARQDGSEPTWRTVASALELSASPNWPRLDSSIPLASDYLAADEIARWIRDQSARDEFSEAAAAALEAGVAGPRDVAILTAAARGWAVERDRESARRAAAEAAAKSRHVARPGDRLELVATVRATIPFSSRYGGGEVVLMSDGDGNLLSWSTGTRHGMSPGEAYAVTATVKEHAAARSKEIEGAPETRLTRLVVTAKLGTALKAPSEVLGLEDHDALDAVFGDGSQEGAVPGL